MSDGSPNNPAPPDNASPPDISPPPFPPPPQLDPETFARLAAEDHSGYVIAAAVSCYAIASIFLLMRFMTRVFIVRKVIAADWMILVAWIFTGGMTAGFILETQHGLGRHILTIEIESSGVFGKLYYATTLCYIAGLVAVKISIVLLFLRILTTARMNRVCYVVLGFVLLFGLYSLITNILTCYPIEKFWDPFNHLDEGWCFPVAKFWSDVACHLLGEIMILVLPMPFIYKLKMPRRQKVAVIFLFALGIFIIIMSISRIPALKKVQTTMDPTWDGIDASIWSCVELNVAVICACCMTLRPLASKLFPGLVSSSYTRQHSDNDGGGGGHEAKNGRVLTFGSAGNDNRRSYNDVALDEMEEDGGPRVIKIPAKTSCSTMSQSTAVGNAGSSSPTGTEKDLEMGNRGGGRS